jgi:hypothetical protein
MNPDPGTQPALIPAQSPGLARAGANSLTARGRADLLKREQAEFWLRKGLEFLDAAPRDPRWDPVDPSNPTSELIEEMVRTFRGQLSSGVSPEIAVQNLKLPPKASRTRPTPEQVSTLFRAWKEGPIQFREALKMNALANAQREAKVLQDAAEHQAEVLRNRNEMLIRAFRCFEKGHESDPAHSELMYRLATFYHKGECIPRDEQKSVDLFRRAAEMGHPWAQVEMGDVYSHNDEFSCLPLDEAQAFKWYEAAAEQANEVGTMKLVQFYQTGIGVKQDHAAAARLLRQAADRGDEWARQDLKDAIAKFGAPYGDDQDALP